MYLRIHYLQHVPFENPGSILTWAESNNHAVSKTLLYENENLPKQSEFDWLVIMGGPMNIYEEKKYKWLKKEKIFIKEAIENNKVVLGICLGAQLIADVIGGKVIRNPFKEIGWFNVTFNKNAEKNPLFSMFESKTTVFEWHGDTFNVLPKEAVVIAENDVCKNQAFVYRKFVIGFQFHLENTLEIITALTENCKEELTDDLYIQSPKELVSHTEYVKQDNALMNKFLTGLFNMYKKECF